MAEIPYRSQFTGEQMDAAFGRIMNMITGSQVLTASVNGYAYGYVTGLETAMSAPKTFASVWGVDAKIHGVVSVTADYDPSTHTLLLEAVGDGIRGGSRYRVDYLLAE